MLTAGTKVRIRGSFYGDGSPIEGVVIEAERSGHPAFSDSALVETFDPTGDVSRTWYYEAVLISVGMIDRRLLGLL
jgi:hypothetical protein